MSSEVNAHDEMIDHERSITALLDAYFQFRSPLPVGGGGIKYIEDCKTTADIIDDLREMDTVTPEALVLYMQRKGYGYKTDADGQVKWAIWRM